MARPEEETRDRICGELEIFQARRGYRFGVEALLLCGFVRPGARRVVDLGCGSGVLSLVLVHFGKAERATGIEIQPALAERARRSVAYNRLGDRIDIVEADLKCLDGRLAPATFDLAVANPPHGARGSGQHSPSDEKAAAKHEIFCSFADVAAAAAKLLAPAGRFVLIHLASRLPEVLGECLRHGLRPLRLRLVHGKAHLEARHFLMEAKKGGRAAALQVEPPLVVHQADGTYSDEVQQMLFPGRPPAGRGDRA